MKKLKKVVLQAVGKLAEVEANIVSAKWPPSCIGYIYQPKRPVKKT